MAFRTKTPDFVWNDTMVPPTTQRIGVVAPTLRLGFRGDSTFQKLTFADNQADEVQFIVQFPHDMALNSILRPHVHFTFEDSVADGDYTIDFVLKYYWANIEEVFPASSSTYTMTYSFKEGENPATYTHLIASGTNLTMNKGISSIMVCRLYRDNLTNAKTNLPYPITMLGFDIHYQIDSMGSEYEISKMTV